MAVPYRRRASRLAASVVAALALALACLAPALAASPHRLAGPITDDVGALSGSEANVQASLDGLQRSTGAQLWVWYTDTLGGVENSAFATQTASASDLGSTDLLLVIALDDHAYGWWKGSTVKISDGQLDQVLSQDMEPALRSSDYPGAITATVDGLLAEMSGGPTPPPETIGPGGLTTPGPEPSAGPGGPTSGAGGDPTGIILVILVVAIAAVGWGLLYARRHPAAGGPAGSTPGDPNADLPALGPKALEELANRTLVETDDAIRDSQQELGFAQAQFGDDASAPFVTAIAAAQEDLKGAFRIRQQLDDSTPEDAPTRRKMLTDLVIACRTARGRLDAELRHFEELRALEKEAPDILARLPAKVDALEARLPASQATLTSLSTYADADWQAVAANVENARTRIAAIREAVDQGNKALASGAAGLAAHAARLGEDGLAQGAAFLDAIDRLAATLEEARSKVDAEIAAATADLATAKTAATKAPPDADAAARLAEADRLLAEARTALDPPKPDVTGAYDKARRANDLADSVVTAIRTTEERVARQAAQLDAGLRAAQLAVTRAADYVGGHRGGIGTDARTRLAEATRHLEQAVALQATDAAGALAEADQASRLAAEAQALAEQDYGRWDDPFRGGRGGGGGGSEIAGAILGGIIGGLLSGGGRCGGFGGGGGGFGGFGGSSGGGSFGGGHGSSGGGRW